MKKSRTLLMAAWIQDLLFLGVLGCMFLGHAAGAAESGYSLLHMNERPNTASNARGFEGRINFGGGHDGERYSGDRWSVAVGHINERFEPNDGWIDTPAGCCGYARELDGFQFVNFSHRWYTKRGRFGWAPQLRLFVGTGVAWRNATTCARPQPSEPEVCWSGTEAVSNRWTFHQTLGFKWRERLEIAWGHDSTGRISAVNAGDDVFRFTLYPLIGRKR